MEPHALRCLNCQSDIPTSSALVPMMVYLTVPDALAQALAGLRLDRPDDWLVFRDPQSDAYWIMKRDHLRAHGVRFSSARVISHGPDLVLRQAFAEAAVK